MRTPGQNSGSTKKTLKGFQGLNNKLDPMVGAPGSQGVAPRTWQLAQVADNVNFTDSGKIVRRDGYEEFVTGINITSSFTTFDFERFYVVDSGVLTRVNEDGSTVQICAGITGEVRWAELNDEVYVSSPNTKVIVFKDDTFAEWGVPAPVGGRVSQAAGELEPGVYQVCFTHIDALGREGGAGPSMSVAVASGGILIEDIPVLENHYTAVYVTSRGTVFRLEAVLPSTARAHTIGYPPAGRELTNQFLDVPPVTGLDVAAFDGRLYVAEYFPDADQSVVWFSEPLGYHLFNFNDSYFIVPGRVAIMASSDDYLMLSTESRVFLYNREGITEVAEYGSIPGQHADIGPDRKLYFWTKRGLCRVSPFENLTESDVSIPPGTKAAGGVIQRHGYANFVVALKSGGAAFNKR